MIILESNEYKTWIQLELESVVIQDRKRLEDMRCLLGKSFLNIKVSKTFVVEVGYVVAPCELAALPKVYGFIYFGLLNYLVMCWR